MLPLVIGGAAVLVAGVAIWAAHESEHAEAEWYARKEDLVNEMDSQRSFLKSFYAEKANNVQFYHLVNEHYKSVQLANSAYQLLTSCKRMIATDREAIKRLKAHRKDLGVKIKISVLDRDSLMLERDLISQEIDRYYQMVADKNEEQQQFLQKVQMLNNETRQLKLMIRDSTGEKGRDWYARSVARRQNRQSA